MHQRWQRGDYEVSTDPARLDTAAIHGYLHRAYWSEGIPRAVVEKAIAGSLNFGLYGPAGLAGYARVITDRATFAWICDVFVLEAHRGRGLGRWLVGCVMAHPELQGLRRRMLATADAHGLYRSYGFEIPEDPGRLMEQTDPDIYRALDGGAGTEG